MTLKTGSNVIAVLSPVFGLITILTITALARQSLANDFRIETEVYVGSEQKPVSQNLTLFSNGLVYDFQMSNEAKPKPLEIVIYNTQDKSFVLIDIQRGIRMELQQVQVIQMVEGLRQQTSQNELTKFLVEDNFEEEADISARCVSLRNSHIEYQFKGAKPPDISVLPGYFEFLDQYTRLNASDPTKLPPFPRLRLNQTIKKYGWIATEVRATLHPNGLFHSKIRLKSAHTMVLSLSDTDRERIKEAKTKWMNSKAVDLATYRGLKKQPRIAIKKPRMPTINGGEDSTKER